MSGQAPARGQVLLGLHFDQTAGRPVKLEHHGAQARVFFHRIGVEQFFRRGRGRQHQFDVAIVKHIIEAHEQTINVRSTEGIGSTFSFTLKKA